MALGILERRDDDAYDRFGRKKRSGFGTEMRTCSVPLF